MKKLFLSLLCPTLLAIPAFGQNPCGTELADPVKQWLNEHQQSQLNDNGSERITRYIPVKFHIVRQSSGAGGYRLANVFQILCELNEKYAPVDFHFYLWEDVNYINNDDYYEHDWSAGADMMNQNNVNDVVNVYVVGDPAGNCGYYTYWEDAIAVAISCMYPGTTTLGHELGHYFSLPHPFDEINDVTEYVDGSNCNWGGDGFCDTPADFLDYRWPCPYTGNQTDPHGDIYEPDHTLFMSYSYDACQDKFSNLQIAAMQDFLLDQRENLLDHPQPASTPIIAQATLTNPVAGESAPHDWVEFQWSAVPNATRYELQVSKVSNFQIIVLDQIATGNGFTAYLEIDQNYWWRVRPFNPGYTCQSFSATETFHTVMSTGVQTVENTAQDLIVYPSLISSEKEITIVFNSAQSEQSIVRLINLEGKVMNEMPVQLTLGSNKYSLLTDGLASGIYLVGMMTGNAWKQVKVIVQ